MESFAASSKPQLNRAPPKAGRPILVRPGFFVWPGCSSAALRSPAPLKVRPLPFRYALFGARRLTPRSWLGAALLGVLRRCTS